MAVLEAASTLTDDQLRERLVDWLRENLPPLWVEAIEEGDDDKFRRARDLVDYDAWCARFGEAGWATPTWPAEYGFLGLSGGQAKVVNGQKVWTTLAHMARWGLLVARTDPDQPKHKGLSYFIVDMKAPGVEVRPLKQITADAEFNEVFFTDVRIPDSMRLGPEGEGW